MGGWVSGRRGRGRGDGSPEVDGANVKRFGAALSAASRVEINDLWLLGLGRRSTPEHTAGNRKMEGAMGGVEGWVREGRGKEWREGVVRDAGRSLGGEWTDRRREI